VWFGQGKEVKELKLTAALRGRFKCQVETKCKTASRDVVQTQDACSWTCRGGERSRSNVECLEGQINVISVV